MLLPFSGALRTFGIPISRGVALAVGELNRAATEVFGGDIIKIVGEDSATNPSVGVDRARHLINGEGVVAIVGALSSGVAVSMAESVAIPSGVVLITPAGTSPLVTAVPDVEGYTSTAPLAPAPSRRPSSVVAVGSSPR